MVFPVLAGTNRRHILQTGFACSWSLLPYPNHVHTIDVVLPFFSKMASVSGDAVMSLSCSALFSLSSTSVSLLFSPFSNFCPFLPRSLALSLPLVVSTLLAGKWARPTCIWQPADSDTLVVALTFYRIICPKHIIEIDQNLIAIPNRDRIIAQPYRYVWIMFLRDPCPPCFGVSLSQPTPNSESNSQRADRLNQLCCERESCRAGGPHDMSKNAVINLIKCENDCQIN